MPERTPLNAVIHGKIERPEILSVERSISESCARPLRDGQPVSARARKGKVPAVLFAHGHWEDGGFRGSGDADVAARDRHGRGTLEQGGHAAASSRCACSWRGWAASSGNGTCSAIPTPCSSRGRPVHGFAKQRPEMNATRTGASTARQAEATLQSIMGLQTWNAVRVARFRAERCRRSIPSASAITGASGGGTQTMLLAAIDPRGTRSFPAVMVSTAMQGGCTCENPPAAACEHGQHRVRRAVRSQAAGHDDGQRLDQGDGRRKASPN